MTNVFYCWKTSSAFDSFPIKIFSYQQNPKREKPCPVYTVSAHTQFTLYLPDDLTNVCKVCEIKTVPGSASSAVATRLPWKSRKMARSKIKWRAKRALILAIVGEINWLYLIATVYPHGSVIYFSKIFYFSNIDLRTEIYTSMYWYIDVHSLIK